LRQLQDGLLRLAFRGIGESGRPHRSDGRYCRLVWGMRGPTHRDADANVYADIHADADDHTHVDAHAALLCLSAAYHEVKERLTMRFLSLAILLAVALLVMASLPFIPAGETQ